METTTVAGAWVLDRDAQERGPQVARGVGGDNDVGRGHDGGRFGRKGWERENAGVGAGARYRPRAWRVAEAV